MNRVYVSRGADFSTASSHSFSPVTICHPRVKRDLQVRATLFGNTLLSFAILIFMFCQ
ncbi:hypothetical protein PS918_00153 [Pseudomonas fluorescens]|uniref:Uncharacterized protein n=1 Tax=Pseudomonas fluorescens TaxID=294 RepID=A0A5E7QTX5_PSEFL|nr:hypothetical protein PS918_00153 [Pseudomonas fluorescens]